MRDLKEGIPKNKMRICSIESFVWINSKSSSKISFVCLNFPSSYEYFKSLLFIPISIFLFAYSPSLYEFITLSLNSFNTCFNFITFSDEDGILSEMSTPRSIFRNKLLSEDYSCSRRWRGRDRADWEEKLGIVSGYMDYKIWKWNRLSYHWFLMDN